MKDKRWYPVLYMFVVTACFSAVVIGFSRLTEKRVEANRERAFELAVLKVLPGMYDKDASTVELHNRFVEKVNNPTEQTAGAYTLQQDGVITAYALPFEGQGFWAQLKGIIGIKADKQTVTGLVIYEQRETPGLGAEVTKEPFRKQFRNLELSTGEIPIDFKRPGEPLGDSEVHAVTGATQTSVRLERIINDTVSKWRSKVK